MVFFSECRNKDLFFRCKKKLITVITFVVVIVYVVVIVVIVVIVYIVVVVVVVVVNVYIVVVVVVVVVIAYVVVFIINLTIFEATIQSDSRAHSSFHSCDLSCVVQKNVLPSPLLLWL